jgi:hypothetical protein
VADQVAGFGFRRGGVSVLATPLSSAPRRTDLWRAEQAHPWEGYACPVSRANDWPVGGTTAGIGSFPDVDGRSILGCGIAERRLGTVPARNERFMAP